MSPRAASRLARALAAVTFCGVIACVVFTLLRGSDVVLPDASENTPST